MWHPSLFNWLSAKTACDVQVVSDSAKEHVGIFVQDSQALTLHAWCQSRTDPNAIQCNTKRLEFAIVCKGPFWHSQTNLAGPNTTVEDARILESEVCMRTSGIGWAHWAPQAYVLEHQVGITILPSLHHTSGAHLNEGVLILLIFFMIHGPGPVCDIPAWEMNNMSQRLKDIIRWRMVTKCSQGLELAASVVVHDVPESQAFCAGRSHWVCEWCDWVKCWCSPFPQLPMHWTWWP